MFGTSRIPMAAITYHLFTVRASLFQTLALIIIAALFFFSRLGCPLQEPEEPRYAEIPRQMLDRSDWMVPMLHGLPYYDKPPLLYWLVMGCYKVFGVHDWAARLVPSGAAFLCVLVTYFWGKRTMGPRAAFAAATILCLSARFVYLGRLLTMNSLLCLWVVAALAAGHLAVRARLLRWRWWLLSAVLCGLGLLTKGPVSLALVVFPVLAFQFLDRRTARPSIGAWSVYLTLAMGLAAPWFVALAARDPAFLGHVFWRHNLIRYVAPFDHAKPVWSYVPELLLGMLPWSLLLLPLVKRLGHKPTSIGERPASLGFFLLTALWCFVFYSFAGSKRAGYILPVMPPLALALGRCLDVMLVREQQPALRGFGPQAMWTLCGAVNFVVLLLGLVFFLPGYANRYSLRDQVEPFAQMALDTKLPVVCYPRAWDSVNFYLHRNDVRVYTQVQRQRLFSDLNANACTLAFVKADRSLDDLLQELPGSLEFLPRGHQAGVTVGWVRQRGEVPATLRAAH
jgi:4-amino-4-deoxy-L-arabinose transferase-like glycosyltransferase